MVACKKLDEVLSYQKPASDKSGLGFTEEGSSSGQAIREMKFVKGKDVLPPSAKEEKVTKNPGVVNQKAIVKNPKDNVTKLNCFKLQALKNTDSQRPQKKGKGAENVKQANARVVDPIIGEVMRMIESITTCLANFTRGLRTMFQVPPPLGTSLQTHVPCG